jgi:hypothetical protein
MTGDVHQPIKLFQFPRMLGVPNLSPFCCKLETWPRIAGIPYEIVDTADPRKGPKGHTRARFDSVPAIVRPLVVRTVQRQIKKMLWWQGTLRRSHEEIVEFAVRDWRAVLRVMGDRPFFFGEEPTTRSFSAPSPPPC